MQVPSIEQLYAGIDIMDSLRTVTFSDEVKLYAAAAVLHEDILFVPPPLDFLQVEIAHPHYKCLDCGSEKSALYHDGVCDSCTKKMATENGLSMRPNQELVASGKGKNMETILRFDPQAAEKRWNEVKFKALAEVDLQENETDTQIAKLLVSRDYMNVRRRQLANQLTSLKSWLGSV